MMPKRKETLVIKEKIRKLSSKITRSRLFVEK